MPTAAMEIDPAQASASPAAIAARRAMIDNQLRPNDVNDPLLITAFDTVAREDFLPVDRRALAYGDRAVSLAGGRAINPALTTARLIADLAPRAGDRVLLIGAATGYAAAILARMGVAVVAVEEDAALVEHARAALAGIDDVTLVTAPLGEGAPAHGPYDAMIVDGAVEALPAGLMAQLKDDAPVVSGLADRGVTRLARAVKSGDAQPVRPAAFADLECVILPGFASPPRFSF